MFGELGVLNNKLRTFTTKVKSDECFLIEIKKDDFIHHIKIKTEIKDYYMKNEEKRNMLVSKLKEREIKTHNLKLVTQLTNDT